MNVKILLIILSSTLVGCSLFNDKPLEVNSTEIDRVELNLPDPNPVNLNDIDWTIITPENAEEVFVDLEKTVDPVLYGLSDEGYEDLSKNMVILRNYILELKSLLREYRDYYEN